MPVLVERKRISKRKILLLRPYILWKRGKENAAERQMLSEIQREEEEKARALEEQKREKENKKKQELELRLEEAKVMKAELTAVCIQREQLEEKLKVLHDEKHRLFICLKTILAQKDTQRKAKQMKEQLSQPVEKTHGFPFSSASIVKYAAEAVPRGKADQGFYQGSPLKRPHSPPQTGSFPYLEQSAPLPVPYTQLPQFYGRTGQPGHQEQQYVDLQGGSRPEYGSHQRIAAQRQEYNRPWQQVTHKSPSVPERRGHSSRQSYSSQVPSYSSASYSYPKTTSQQRKTGQKH